MMSSEEETDCLGLYGDKLKKAKRQRQRVDAGEPRNSYSSIPNFSSRPTFLSGGLYGAFFSQGHSLGLLGQGFGTSSKMLNELLSRQVKAATEAGAAPNLDFSMDSVNGNVEAAAAAAAAAAAVIRRGLDEEPNPELAHHMLRDILQGRKKELLALEQEFHDHDHDPAAIINNNNNTTANNNELKNGGDSSESSESATSAKLVNGVDNSDVDDDAKVPDAEASQQAAVADVENDSDSDASLVSRDSEARSHKDADDDADFEGDDKDGLRKLEPRVEIKRKRVEDIVSSMARASPSLPVPAPVNGCKKRKLYQPQQHDAGLGLALGLHQSLLLEDADDSDGPQVRQKRVEKSVLKTQLRSMQEQLAEMQHKYVQLCSRMERESEDAASDMDADQEQDGDQDTEQDGEQEEEQIDQDAVVDADADNSLSSDVKVKSSPPPTPVKEVTPVTTASATVGLSKMAPPKIHPHHGSPLYQMPLPLSLLQQQHEQNHAPPPPPPPPPPPFSHHHGHHTHPHLSSAAAMYLGVGHKLLMEQEARLAKEAAVAAAVAEHHRSAQLPHHPQSGPQHPQPSQPQPQHHLGPQPQHTKDFSERFNMYRESPVDLDSLAEVLKSELTTSMKRIINSIISRYAAIASASTDSTNRDMMMAQLLDRKSPRTKVVDRLGNPSASDPQRPAPGRVNGAPNTPNSQSGSVPNGNNSPSNSEGGNGSSAPNGAGNGNSSSTSHSRPSALFPPNKLNAAAAIYGMTGLSSHVSPFCLPERSEREGVPEQNEALSLVVTTKKKRHKVTDTRITPRTVSRMLAHDGVGQPVDAQGAPISQASPAPGTPHQQTTPTSQAQSTPPHQAQTPVSQTQGPSMQSQQSQNKYGLLLPPSGSSDSPPPPLPPQSQRAYHPPPPMLPVSLPTSVAIPNPGLHESQVFSPYSPFYQAHAPHLSASPPLPLRDSTPPMPPLLHPALMAAAHAHHGSPDYSALRTGTNPALESLDRGSDCNSGDGPYDGISSFNYRNIVSQMEENSMNGPHSATLSPMHLRKAKLMFFWVRYPSSSVLKMYFPDIKFNKNNTAQLVKWFSNFREFYYIQMEKYARQAVSEGVKTTEDLSVTGDCDIYRVLNLHYNRNNHIEVPQNFRFVVEQTLKEFFKAIQGGKDTEQSWKKSIYKVISRLDDPVPEYFKSPNFLDQLV